MDEGRGITKSKIRTLVQKIETCQTRSPVLEKNRPGLSLYSVYCWWTNVSVHLYGPGVGVVKQEEEET